MQQAAKKLRSLFVPVARRISRHEYGYAVVEFAMIAPMFVLLLLGAFDFARVFYFAMAVSGAAHAGAQWGSLSPGNAGNTGQMRTVAENHSPSLGVTASASRLCRCGNGTNTPTNQSCVASCAGTLRMYASVTATRSFSPIVGFPGIPGTVNISRTAQMRAQ